MAANFRPTAFERILEVLQPVGFWMTNCFGTDLDIGEGVPYRSFIRRSLFDSRCFEELELDDYGKGLSIWVHTTFLPGSTGSTLTRKGQAVDFADGVSWRDVSEQTRKGKAWLKKLCELADSKSRMETEKHGELLLKKSRRARRAAKFYLDCIEQPFVGFRNAFDRLAAVSTEEQVKAGHRGLDPSYPTVLSEEEGAVDEAIALYKFITLTIARNPQGAEQEFFPFGTTPEDDWDLEPCVRVMASVLFQEPCSEHICFD